MSSSGTNNLLLQTQKKQTNKKEKREAKTMKDSDMKGELTICFQLVVNLLIIDFVHYRY